jgi:hypothetical protein
VTCSCPCSVHCGCGVDPFGHLPVLHTSAALEWMHAGLEGINRGMDYHVEGVQLAARTVAHVVANLQHFGDGVEGQQDVWMELLLPHIEVCVAIVSPSCPVMSCHVLSCRVARERLLCVFIFSCSFADDRARGTGVSVDDVIHRRAGVPGDRVSAGPSHR